MLNNMSFYDIKWVNECMPRYISYGMYEYRINVYVAVFEHSNFNCSSFIHSLQKLPGQASGGEQHLSDMRERHPSVASAAVHQLRSDDARHRLQAGAQSARKYVCHYICVVIGFSFKWPILMFRRDATRTRILQKPQPAVPEGSAAQHRWRRLRSPERDAHGGRLPPAWRTGERLSGMHEQYDGAEASLHPVQFASDNHTPEEVCCQKGSERHG